MALGAEHAVVEGAHICSETYRSQMSRAFRKTERFCKVDGEMDDL